MDGEARVRAGLSAGDYDGAATAALETYGCGVFGYLCTLLAEDEARDAFSFFAEDLWRSLPAFRGDCSLRAWAYRLAWLSAARVARDAYRRRRQRLPSSAASRLAAQLASASGLAHGGRRDRLGRLRGALTPEEQSLLVLRIDRELEWDEISAILGAEGEPVSSAALRKRFERLKEKLAQLAREQGLVD